MSSKWYEADYRRTVHAVESTSLLPGTNIEVISPPGHRPPPQHVLFDFDGTLSLIREGWPEVMIPMMVEVLQAHGHARVGRVLLQARLRHSSCN